MTILFLKVGRLGVKNHFPDKKKKKKHKTLVLSYESQTHNMQECEHFQMMFHRS